ncbi:unnamed protein product [Mesocestoides corti]|uniref:Uncharacterized protein n=1 Tax=Mesocestoides corti TaxID=53468 RepID=A0A0R3UIT6_MESCO|nr:unnamed protein product [Mesocestoides corti]
MPVHERLLDQSVTDLFEDLGSCDWRLQCAPTRSQLPPLLPCMLRRGGADRGSCKKVSIAENGMGCELRRLQEDILAQIRNRSAFPLRKVPTNSRQHESREGKSTEPITSVTSTLRRHSTLIRTQSIFDEPQLSPTDSSSFPLPSPPLPSPPPPELLPSPLQSFHEPIKSQTTINKFEEENIHLNVGLKNTVRFHENNAEPRQQHSVKYSTCRPNTYQSSTLRNHGLSRGITSGSQNMVNFCQPLRSSIDSVGYRSSQSTDETADYRNRPTSPPLKYSPSEDVFNPTKTTQQVFRVSKKAQVEEDSPTGSDVDAVISKEETKRKQAETRQTTLPRHHFSPSSPTLSERTRRPSGRIFKNFGRSEDPPSPLTYPRPHNSAVKYCITSNEESDEKDEKTRISQVAERPKILATRGVRPFRGVSAINAKGVSSPSGSSSSVVTVDSSVGEDGDIQRGRWVFPGKRTIYSEESQQAQYEMRSNLRVKDCPSTEVKRPPHHYTGPWMFKGLSPRLSIPNEISRERRNSCSGSSKPLHFCHATQSDPPQAIMVDRMVSPISSPPPGAETACGAPSISTLGRTRTPPITMTQMTVVIVLQNRL